MSSAWLTLAYLVAAACFILGLKRLSSPRTAPAGNRIAALGMLIAIAVTLLNQEIVRFEGIVAGMVIGGAIGAYSARKVKMTAMPQMVAIFNGLGGGASALVAGAELMRLVAQGQPPSAFVSVPIVLGTLIGAVTLTGSLVAFAKLQGLVSGAPTSFPLQHPLNLILSLVLLGLGGGLVLEPEMLSTFWIILGLASLLGILLVIPIGGADMPVVISLLNSYSGLAACATGFVIQNHALIISGSLVGASGLILTQIMCRAMNRSLANVLFGGFGVETAAPGAAAVATTGAVKSGSAEDAAAILDAARSVIIVPGYGLAVAQAQHVVRELGDRLMQRGVDVKYAIHPVAGRMPGHMNVLLAEAEVPYELLIEMEEINPSFPRTDVALVLGANDVTNPSARDDPSCAIYGMPILEVDRSKTVMVCKRSMNPGFAGIDNPLFTLPNTMMIFGDAKQMMEAVTKALSEL